MTFPDQKHASVGGFFDAYAQAIARAMASVSRPALAEAERLLSKTLAADGQIFACGNGGSAAISNHLVCDHAKGISADTGLKPRVQSLSATVELVTAIANDVSYAEIFSYQLALFGRPGDVLITISSSGDSENVVRAIAKAREIGMGTIALTGFEGGRTRAEADVALHVDADNYGIIEDVHQGLMHVLAQFIRLDRMPEDLIKRRKF